MTTSSVNDAPLGRKIGHAPHYHPGHLFPISRKEGRKSLDIEARLPFYGVDIWNAYEVSWLDSRGKPEIGMLEIRFPCHTEKLIESKSLKLYLNSFNQTRFFSAEAVVSFIKSDLSEASGGRVSVLLIAASEFHRKSISSLPKAVCIDEVPIEIDRYQVTPDFLAARGSRVEERLFSRLLRTKCPVTGQPDWADLFIAYSGPQIDPQGLLRYVVSFREHAGFHENCVEQIYMDILRRCKPEKLSVYARFTRRGGIDINPFRASFHGIPDNMRCARQ
jgi:7-cyano-7-deazaguanine reductase